MKEIILSSILLLGSGLSVFAQERYLVAFSGVSGSQGALWSTKDLGVFGKYGLNAELIFIAGGARGVQALLGGSVHFYTGDPIAPMSAMLQGGEIAIIGATINQIPGSLVTRKEIRNPVELRGKKIGIVNFGGSNELSVVLALKKWNIPLEAVALLPSGNSADRLAALLSGALDATPLAPPLSFEAARRGMNLIADLPEIAPFPQTVIVVRRAFLKEKREIAKRFMQSFSEGIYQFMTNKENALAVYRKGLRQKDSAIIEETYSYYQGRFSLPPRVARGEGLTLAVKMIAQRADRGKTELDVEQFIEESILDELEKEGFFKKLSKRNP